MKRRAALEERIGLALLPVLGGASSLSEALGLATLTAGVFLGLGLLYRKAWPVFPKRGLGFSAVLTLACLGSAAWYFFDTAPLWIASVLLLGVFDFRPKAAQQPLIANLPGRGVTIRLSGIFLRAALFWIVLTGLGALRSAAGRFWPAGYMDHPGTALLILAAILCFFRARHSKEG
ncbi:MAG: hypothetical protein WC352_01685 [Candidatus Omnitrophota bacterium]|jgi:hypothetical protein